VQTRVEPNLARRRIVLLDQGAGIVEQHLLRHAAEVAERRLDPVEPGRLALVPERTDKTAPRIAQRRHEQVHPDALAADRNPRLAEIDLQLTAGRRLKSHRHPCLGHERLPQRRDCPLDRAQADHNALLARQVLANDIGIAAVPAKPLGEPVLQPIQGLPTPRRPVARPAPGRDIAPNRHMAAPELGRDPPDAPTQPPQPQHRRDLVRLPHPFPPQLVKPRRTSDQSVHLRDLLSLREGPVPHVAPGPVFHVA
jgi:hypothetical protein